MTPDLVLDMRNAAKTRFITQIHIGREFIDDPVAGPRLGPAVPQWYGETVGFWDEETLVAWTDHIQGWTMSHALPEFSSEMEAVEVYSPCHDASGKLIGMKHEAIFYDPEALVEPIRIVRDAEPHG